MDVDLARAEDLRMLQSLFVFFLNDSLSGSDLAPPLRLEVLELIQAVPAMGPHWEKIGFQGLDPRTDLNRAMKMLSVLQVLISHSLLHCAVSYIICVVLSCRCYI